MLGFLRTAVSVSLSPVKSMATKQTASGTSSSLKLPARQKRRHQKAINLFKEEFTPAGALLGLGQQGAENPQLVRWDERKDGGPDNLFQPPAQHGGHLLVGIKDVAVWGQGDGAFADGLHQDAVGIVAPFRV